MSNAEAEFAGRVGLLGEPVADPGAVVVRGPSAGGAEAPSSPAAPNQPSASEPGQATDRTDV